MDHTVETEDDYGSLADQWGDAIELASKAHKKWQAQGTKVVKRYRDERPESSKSKKFNILWSNVETIKPALYANLPKPQVSRRFKDPDPVGRAAAEVLERALEFTVDAYDFGAVMKSSVEDFLLPGRSVSRVRYKPTFDAEGLVVYEEAICEYHFWKDFLHGPGRVWAEVDWVAFRYFPDRAELVEQFGDKGRKVKLDYRPKERGEDTPEQFKKAVVWEIWSKKQNKVIWLATSDHEVLDSHPPKLKLHGFFPCPRPLFSLVTNDSLIPVPDYLEYQDQAEELDELSARIGILVGALRVVGFYASEEKDAMTRITIDGDENTMIPIDSWAAFADKGGIKGHIDWLPMEQIIQVVNGLYEARDRTKQELYEITGLSDIIRGVSNPNETATAQRIKGQFASLRLMDRQKLVSEYARDLLRLKAEVICEHFDPQTIQMMTGLDLGEEMWAAVMALLKDDPRRTFRIDIETESTIQIDEQADKEARIEFVRAMTDFIGAAGQATQLNPDMGPLFQEMMLFSVRGFHVGRELEQKFEEALAQSDGEDLTPEQEQQQQQQMMMEQQQQEMLVRREMAEIGKLEGEAALKQVEAQERQVAMQEKQARMQLIPLEGQNIQADTALKGANAQKAGADAQTMAIEAQRPPQIEAPIDPQDTELGRAEKLGQIQKTAAETQDTVVSIEERKLAMKHENRKMGGKSIKMTRTADGSLMGEVTDANGDTTHAVVKRDDDGNLEGNIGPNLTYDPLSGDINADSPD